jgi:hypothetical protein
MRTLLAILLTLLTVLPHPALLASAKQKAPDCTGGSSGCACCPAGECECSLNKEDLPVTPVPALPVSVSDFHPVVAAPPVQGFEFALMPVVPERKSQPAQAPLVSVNGQDVPLYVRHRAFLI